jgi:hypothetical protein
VIVVVFLVVLLIVSSLEFLSRDILSYMCQRDPRNEWDVWWTESNEGVHSLGWESREEESWWKIKIIVGEYQWIVGLWEWTMRDNHILWIVSPISWVTCC